MACVTCHEGTIRNINEQGLINLTINHAIFWAKANNETEMVIILVKGKYTFRARAAAPITGETIVDNIYVQGIDP